MFGFINLTREVYREMCASRRGVIINIAGLAGKRPTANYIAGSMGNASLMALSRALGADSHKDGIRVVGINPGAIETDMMMTDGPPAAESMGISYQDLLNWFASESAIKRLNDVEDVALVASLLASDAGAGITGSLISVDGGTAPY